MSSRKPTIPKGTRDFLPGEMSRREYIFSIIRRVFRSYGYQPIETPAMENLSTLLGKYGEEGDKLLFRILNSGNFLENVPGPVGPGNDVSSVASAISEKGLRYDLTVPFARFVVQHQHEVLFPFKRYQIQPVWRADRPQKGRYREFFQCDVDAIGSNSLIYEVELVQIADRIFSELGIETVIRINNRKILAGVAETIRQPDKLTEITTAIDKLEKAGLENVMGELLSSGISEASIGLLKPFIRLEGKIKEKISFLEEFMQNSVIGKKGIEETRYVLEYLKGLDLKAKFEFDVRLARGLNYYTGIIIEIMAKDVGIGSICGGGRYDDLTGIFGLPGVSGVGISFGADRIYDVMQEKNLFPANLASATAILFVNFGLKEEKYCQAIAERLRGLDIPAEIYPEAAKVKKQLEYASRKSIPYVAIIGEEEMKKGMIMLKNMATGEQSELTEADVIKTVTSIQ